MNKYFSFIVLYAVMFVHAGANAQVWQNLAEIPTARSGAAAVVYEGRIYLLGGMNAQGNALSSVERYNPGNNSWETDLPELRKTRLNAAAVVFNDQIHVFGGREDEGEILKKVEFFDVQENKWEGFKDLEYLREGASAVVIDNRMYVIGGFGSSEDQSGTSQFLGNVEYYDQNAEEWIIDPAWSLDLASASHSSVVYNDSVFTAGGFSTFGPLDRTQVFSPGSGSSLRNAMPAKRGGHAAAASKHGILILGGRDELDNVLDTIQLFRPDLNSWEQALPLPQPRENFSAVSIGDKVFIFGGLDILGRTMSSVQSARTDDLITSVSGRQPIQPGSFSLIAVYPNPFNPEASITFRVGDRFRNAKTQLRIYNISGQLVRTLVEERLTPGNYQRKWHGSDNAGNAVGSGTYIIRLQQAGVSESLTVTLIR